MEAQNGRDRSRRYVHLDAEHAAHNILLEAVGPGLGAVGIGAQDDGGVQPAFGLPSDHTPLHLIPVGHAE